MSIAATKWAWDQTDLSGSEKLVLMRLADHAQPDGTSIRPGMRSLMVYTGLSERQIRRYIQGFIDRGLIAYEANEHGGRGHIPTFYIPSVKGDTDGHLLEHERRTRATPKRTQRGTPVTVKADTHDTKRRTPKVETPADSFKEPSIEPSRTVMQRHGAAQTLVAVLYEDVLEIGPPTNYKQAVGQAAALVKAGCTPDELTQIATWLLADPWHAKRGVTMGSIVSQRDSWRATRKVPDGTLRVVGGRSHEPRGNSMSGFDAFDAEIDAQMNGYVDEPDDVIDVKVNAR